MRTTILSIIKTNQKNIQVKFIMSTMLMISQVISIFVFSLWKFHNISTMNICRAKHSCTHPHTPACLTDQLFACRYWIWWSRPILRPISSQGEADCLHLFYTVHVVMWWCVLGFSGLRCIGWGRNVHMHIVAMTTEQWPNHSCRNLQVGSSCSGQMTSMLYLL